MALDLLDSPIYPPRVSEARLMLRGLISSNEAEREQVAQDLAGSGEAIEVAFDRMIEKGEAFDAFPAFSIATRWAIRVGLAVTPDVRDSAFVVAFGLLHRRALRDLPSLTPALEGICEGLAEELPAWLNLLDSGPDDVEFAIDGMAETFEHEAEQERFADLLRCCVAIGTICEENRRGPIGDYDRHRIAVIAEGFQSIVREWLGDQR